MDPMSEYLARATIEARIAAAAGSAARGGSSRGRDAPSAADGTASRSPGGGSVETARGYDARQPGGWPSPSPARPPSVELAQLLEEAAHHIAERGTGSERRLLEAMAEVAAPSAPGAAAALVDRDGAEASRLRAFGLRARPPAGGARSARARAAARPPGRRGRRRADPPRGEPGSASWPDACRTRAGALCQAARRERDARPRQRGSRRRRWSSSCSAGPASRSTARPATASAAARAGRCWRSCCWPSGRRRAAGWPRCCSPRPTTRWGRCGGAWPRSAAALGPGGRARRRPGRDSRCPPAPRWTSTCWSTGTGATPSSSRASAPTCSTASPSSTPRPFESWLLSAATPARGRGRVDPARGRAGATSPAGTSTGPATWPSGPP